MTSPQSSLASLLGNAGARQDLSLDRNANSDEAILDFIQENYHEADPGLADVIDPAFSLTRATEDPSQSHLHSDANAETHAAGDGSPSNGAVSRRSASPVDTSVQIPSALAELAASNGPALHLDIPSADAVIDATFAYNDYGERGEMGGKRKKAPHERAGWKEMDENRGRKRGRKAGTSQSAVGAGGGGGSGSAPNSSGPRELQTYEPLQTDTQGLNGQHLQHSHSHPHEQKEEQQQGQQVQQEQHDGQVQLDDPTQDDITLASTALARDLAQAQAEMGLDVAGLSHEDGAAIARAFEEHHVPAQIIPGEVTLVEEDEHAAEREKARSAGSRAEQNRRAQQVYRRKREERMKQLEAAAAALEPTRRIATDLGVKLKQLAVSFEAAKLENAALRMALVTASQAGHSVLTSDGSLVINKTMNRSTRPSSQEDVTAAFGKLERQSRELAKQNRATQGQQ
ncbi:hypothetical protein EHS25_006217 [Saitozyma podzolica]|uniref:BZIP domain-containing protein n=1 Tax=Saitozyma podzolica TaxID=1890683 RepID=A0A427XS03_9TREE|nr:hypothetical protein EHS25_006217 [Saitozyma podzolica]